MRNDSKQQRRRPAHFSFTESDGLQAGDGVGNRQKFSESRIHADDIGNRLGTAEIQGSVRDDIGNSIGASPTHEQSGILASFDGRGRRRREASHHDRNSSYAVGGVNPLVSGNQALLSMFANQEEPAAPATQEEPRAKKRPEKASDSGDRWLKRLLELDDEERQEAGGQGDPKQKAVLARAALEQIFERAGVMAAIGTQIVPETETERPSVIVSFEDIDKPADIASRLSTVFAQDSISLLALNFLVNKIVNRNPEERVRIQVALRSEQ